MDRPIAAANVPAKFLQQADALPQALRALLEAELAAGNSIAEVRSTFPAPPAGAYFKMSAAITTCAHESANGIVYREFPNWTCGGAFTDEHAFFFILQPDPPPPAEPDMDAIRAALATEPSKPAPVMAPPSHPALATPLERFERSMNIDYEKWHDGIGYDLDAIAEASPDEHTAIELMLMERANLDWRDIEAFAALKSPRANKALGAALNNPSAEIRLAVTRSAPELVSETQRLTSLLDALESATFTSGLAQTLTEAASFHPQPVIDCLFRGLLRREGSIAVHFAAMLLLLHGKAESSFDWNQRPFLLRFNTPDPAERQAVFVELCAIIGVDPKGYL